MRWRRRCASRTVTPLVRFEGLPGEFSQHDFGEVWVTYQDGTETKVHFFASRLEVLAVGRGHARARRARRNARARAGRASRRLRRHSAGRGLRSAEDDRAQVGTRRRRHGVESDVCRRGARPRDRRRGVLAVSPARKRQRRESRRLGQGLVLQAAALSRSRGSRAAAARVAHRGEYGRGRRGRPACRRPRGSRRSAPGCGR